MPDLQFTATINGRKIARSAKPHQRLLDFIRDDLNLTGNKEGCGAGECGTCSVFVNGVLMKSCLMPLAKAQGANIETVEALAKTGELSVLQRRFTRRARASVAIAFPAW
jgi:aerobic-type carbon monoxide dehydrogenase small subunit (CoxS/CutS family)